MALTTLQFTSRKARDEHYHKLQVLGHKLMTRGTTQQAGKMVWELYYEPHTSTTSRAGEAVAELETIQSGPLSDIIATREVSDGPIEGESGVEATLGSDAERDSVGDVPPIGAIVDGPATI